MKIGIGDKIKFLEEKQCYTVRAFDERFVVCTKPFNLRKTVLYTIIDLKKLVRGTEDLLFCKGFETDKQCWDAVKRLSGGKSEVSFRNRIKVKIEKVIKPKQEPVKPKPMFCDYPAKAYEYTSEIDTTPLDSNAYYSYLNG